MVGSVALAEAAWQAATVKAKTALAKAATMAEVGAEQAATRVEVAASQAGTTEAIAAVEKIEALVEEHVIGRTEPGPQWFRQQRRWRQQQSMLQQ